MKKYLEIYQHFVIFTIMCSTVKCANYDRYPESSSSYPYPVSTISNLYDQHYKLGTYGSDIANFPEATRYPNYNPAHTSPRYDSFTTPRSNVFEPAYQSSTGYQSNVPNYNTAYGQGLGQGYGQGQGLGQGYGQGQGLGQSYGQGQTSYEMPFMGSMRDYCQDRSAQKDILLDNLMGMWYAVEHIQHLAGDSRVDRIRTCIVILISEPMDRPSTEYQLFHVQHINAKFRQEWRHIRLLWDEAGLTTEYTLYFKNDSAGYWQNFGRQNGTLASQPNYQQFGGTVQVLKAVNDHLVLNFCQEASSGQAAQLYTVLFTRLPGHMDQWELDGIHNMLQNKKLSVASRRMVCGNSGVKAIYSVAMMVISCLLALAIRTS